MVESARELAEKITRELFENLEYRPYEFIKATLDESLRYQAQQFDPAEVADIASLIEAKFNRQSPDTKMQSTNRKLQLIVENLDLRSDPTLRTLANLLHSYGIAVRIDDLALTALFPDREWIRWSIYTNGNMIVAGSNGSGPVDGLSQMIFEPESQEAEQHMMRSLAFEARAFLWKAAESLRRHTSSE
jgi:hypothetical protein